MIVVSASLKKSGSGWYFNMTNDLLVQAGNQDVREVRRAYGLEGVLLEDNCRINPNIVNLARLMRPHRQGNTFVVKTHAGPTPSLRLLMNRGMIKATYIYRDPRDVVLSALDHGARVRKAGKANILAEIKTVEQAVAYVATLLRDWDGWTATPHTLLVRYEDLVADTWGELKRLVAFLAVDITEDRLRSVAAPYQKDNQDSVQKSRLHFNKGIAGRFRSQMSADELALCAEQFGPYLQRMGYAP